MLTCQCVTDKSCCLFLGQSYAGAVRRPFTFAMDILLLSQHVQEPLGNCYNALMTVPTITFPNSLPGLVLAALASFNPLATTSVANFS